MKKNYIKIIDGVEVIKSSREIIIRNGNKVIYGPTHEMILKDGWVPYEPVVHKETPEEVLERTRHAKLMEIADYDASEKVNEFSIGEYKVWLDKATRAGLMLRFQAEQAMGKTETVLWYEGMSFPLNLEIAFQMLFALENYASMCYDNTQNHISKVKSISSQKELDSYDFTAGYPTKLQF